MREKSKRHGGAVFTCRLQQPTAGTASMVTMNLLRRALLFVVCLVCFAGAAIIAWQSLGYFTDPAGMPFLRERSTATMGRHWAPTVAAHAAGGVLCFAALLPQFSRRVLRRLPSLHRAAGTIYVAAVLWVLCPTGFVLACQAKGGAAGRAGFLILGILTFVSTLAGWLAMRRGDVPGHVRWMIRSSAWVATAVTFRLLHLLLWQCGLEATLNYVVSLWLTNALHFAAAELAVRRLHLSRSSHPIHHEDNRHPDTVRPRDRLRPLHSIAPSRLA